MLESARRLADPSAALVLAGQQPGLLGGPLYNACKAVHVVRLARALEEHWQTPVVPAFWNHADDHDVAEVHHLWVQNQNLDLRKIGVAGMSSGRTPLGRIRFAEERHHLRAIEELLRQDIGDGPERDAALELFLPREGETFASSFTRVLLGLFGHMGLLVIEPEWIRESLSRALATIVTSDLQRSLVDGARSVRLGGGAPPIDPADAEIPTTYLTSGGVGGGPTAEVTRAALGYLHANCGQCHGGVVPQAGFNMFVDIGLANVDDTGVWMTGVGQTSIWADPDMPGPLMRIAPGDPMGSSVHRRMSRRGDGQMPPIASEVVDMAGVMAVDAWITALMP